MLPFDGITVGSLGRAIAPPLSTRPLADLDARGLKIARFGIGAIARVYDERVRGMSSHVVCINRYLMERV